MVIIPYSVELDVSDPILFFFLFAMIRVIRGSKFSFFAYFAHFAGKILISGSGFCKYAPQRNFLFPAKSNRAIINLY